MPVSIQFMSFDRDNVDRVSLITKEGKRKTTAQQIEEILAKGRRWIGRRDIGMVNVWNNENMSQHVAQYYIEPTQSGEPDFGTAELFLTEQEKEELRRINERVIKVEHERGWPKGTLSGWR